MGISDWKSEFDNAKVSASATYMEPGNFLLRIDKIAEGKNRKGVENFKVEGTIIHKLDPNGSQAVGASVCDMYSRASDYFAQELKALVSGMFSLPAESVSFEQLAQISDEKQPMKGIVVEYFAYKKEGSQFTKKYCRGMKTQEEVKAQLSEQEWNTYSDSLKFIG